MFQNIPDEMKEYPHWVLWRFEQDNPDDKPTKVLYNARTGRKALTNAPGTWATFAECVNCFNHGLCDGIGFVLNKDNPYMIVDLDNPYEQNHDGSFKYEKPDEIMELQKRIYKGFDSYAEKSPSGNGLHIITKGIALPNGRRRMSVEMYSDGRFMTMTGNVYGGRNVIVESDELRNNAKVLWEQLGGGPEKVGYDGNADQKYDDTYIINQCRTAKNAETVELLLGDWRSCGRWDSQSEADMAFVNIISFYTQNREQIKRLFNASPLGQRNKQTTIRGKSYLNHMIDKSFDRMLPPVDLDGLRNQLEAAIAKHNNQQERNSMNNAPHIADIPPEYKPVVVVDDGQGGDFDAPADMSPSVGSVYSRPPGLVGDIADFIYRAAPRPVPEIALTAALGLMAGICGRAYNVSNTGLNQYVLLLAPTGTGKEAIASGIGKLMVQVHKRVVGAYDFVGPGEIASSQALIKFMSKGRNSFVSVVGEFGIYLQEMTATHAPPHKVALKRLMLDLFTKSGKDDVVRPSIFSDSDKNTEIIRAPNYTMIGESTPERFYEGLNEDMITEGLLPRFTVIEYNGKRPRWNKSAATYKPDEGLVTRLSDLCGHVIMLNGGNEAIPVDQTSEAAHMFDLLNEELDDRINGEMAKELTKSLWSRAHLKAMKLAAVIAVGCNYLRPVITAEIAQWAINIVRADAGNMLNRFNSGEVGSNSEEVTQVKDATRVVRDYLLKPWSEVQAYAPSHDMHSERVIPFSYISRRLQCIASFRKDRMGATNSIKRVIQTFVDRGDLSELSKVIAHQKFNSSARCFAITVPRSFGL